MLFLYFSGGLPPAPAPTHDGDDLAWLAPVACDDEPKFERYGFALGNYSKERKHVATKPINSGYAMI